MNTQDKTQVEYKWIVWAGGVDDYYTSYEEALEHYDEWIEQGYEDVQIEKIDEAF